MLTTARRAVALLEMVVALSLFGIVLSAFAALVGRQERLHATLNARIAAAAQLREGQASLALELLELSPAQGDISEAQDSAIAIRAVVETGLVCDTAPGSVALPPPDPDPARSTHARLTRAQAGDTAWIWAGGPGTARWVPAQVQSVSESAARCPDSLAAFPLPRGPRTVLTLDAPGTATARQPGAPVRVTRRVRWSLYRASDRRWWLGMREQAASTGLLATIQPVLGPLRPYATDSARSGASFHYLDAAGQELLPGASLTSLTLVRIVLRADSATARASPHAAGLRDTIVIAVAPRG